MAREQRNLTRQVGNRSIGDGFKVTRQGIRNAPFNGIKNGINLGALAGGPAFSREGEAEENLFQPARNKSLVQAMMLLCGRVNRWELAAAW